MTNPTYQLIGRRGDRPQRLLFRDAEGRHFLRADCGARLVRISRRDAKAIMRQYHYRTVLDSAWRSEAEVYELGCVVPFEPPADFLMEQPD
jgi:hypothetical protein